MPTLMIKNYRRFTSQHPARFEIGPGATAFIGVNNSGKSSLLRFLYDYRAMFASLHESSAIGRAMANRMEFTFPPEVRDQSENFAFANELPMEISLEWSGVGDTDVGRAVFVIERDRPNFFSLSLYSGSGLAFPNSSSGFTDDQVIQGGIRINVGALLDTAKTLTSTVYIGPFRNILDGQLRTTSANGNRYFDIEIGSNLVHQWRNLKTGQNKSAADLAFSLRSDIAALFGFDDFEIDAANDGGLQLRIDRRHFGLTEVGAGLTQFIIVLLNIAINRHRLILVDEPELHLHPRLQLEFLSALDRYASDGILFATHSLALARLYADRTYAVQPIGPRESQMDLYDSVSTLTEFLTALGYTGGADGGASRVLLVEGKTDVKVTKQFLRTLGHTDVVVVHLGGGNLISGAAQDELVDLRRFAHIVSAVVDSERSDPDEPLSEARRLFVAACGVAEIPCKVLDRRATENYFTDRAIKSALGGGFRALEPFEKLSQVENGWGKGENWKIAAQMSEKELLDTDFGRFLSTLTP